MKIWIVTAFLLLAAVAAVYVVWTVVLTGTGPGSAYDIPKGRYDCFMMTSQVLVMSDLFPEPRNASGNMPVPRKADYEESVELLGRTFTVAVYGKEATYARLSAQQAIRYMERVAAMADLSSEDSELSKINREAAERHVPLSPDMYYLLTRSLEIGAKSKGNFDITAGPLRALWASYAERRSIPPSNEISEALTLVGSRYVEINPSRRTIHFTRKGVALDLRDVIGGFIVDQGIYALRLENVASGYVRTGDCWRYLDHFDAESGRTWDVGIPHTDPNYHRGQMSRTFSYPRGAVVSKGYYSGYTFIGATPVSDIINPRDGTSVGGVAVCTVVGPDALTCDAMASALVVLGGSQVRSFLGQFNPREDVVKPKRKDYEE